MASRESVTVGTSRSTDCFAVQIQTKRKFKLWEVIQHFCDF